jgi:hypothetical protein
MGVAFAEHADLFTTRRSASAPTARHPHGARGQGGGLPRPADGHLDRFLLPRWSSSGCAGTTDFTAGGILAGKLGHGALAGLLALCMFGIGKAALTVPPGCRRPWSRPPR